MLTLTFMHNCKKVKKAKALDVLNTRKRRKNVKPAPVSPYKVKLLPG